MRSMAKRRATKRRNTTKRRMSKRRMTRGGGFIPNGINKVPRDDQIGIINHFRNQEKYANDFNGKDNEESFGIIYNIVNTGQPRGGVRARQPHEKELQITYMGENGERRGTILKVENGKLTLGIHAPRSAPHRQSREAVYEP